jgi:cation transport ATPase
MELSQINKTEELIKDFHKDQIKKQKEKGHEDGIRNMPNVEDTEITPHEHSIVSKYQGLLAKIFRTGRPDLDEYHDKEYVPLVQELEQLTDDKKEELTQDLENNHSKVLKNLEANYYDNRQDNHNDLTLRNLKKDLQKAEDTFDEKSKILDRKTLNTQFKPYWAYLALIIVLGIAEIPMNNQVFTSFRETPLLTYIMSLVLVIAIPFLSHTSGKLIRQYKEQKQAKFLVPIIVIIITVLTYFTSILRVKYLATKGVSASELDTDFWVFFILGLVLYLVGLLASYFAHDSSVDFPEIYKNYHTLKKDLTTKQKEIDIEDKRLTSEYQKQREQEQNRYNTELKSLQKNKDTLFRKIQNIAGSHDKILNSYKGLELMIEQFMNETIQAYRDHNWRSRNNHAQPVSWQKELPKLECYFENYNELCPNKILEPNVKKNTNN